MIMKLTKVFNDATSLSNGTASTTHYNERIDARKALVQFRITGTANDTTTVIQFQGRLHPDASWVTFVAFGPGGTTIGTNLSQIAEVHNTPEIRMVVSTYTAGTTINAWVLS